MLRRDTTEQSEQSHVTTQTDISANSAASPSLVLDTRNGGVACCVGTVPAGTEFPDIPIGNVSPVSTLPYSEVRGVKVEDGSDLKDMEESGKNENGILCTISSITNVESSQETGPVLAETTRPAAGSVPVLQILSDLHVERTVGEEGAGGGGGGDDIAEFHSGHLSQRAYVITNRAPSASDEIETDYLAAVPVSREIPHEANADAYNALGAMSFHEAPSADITVSSVENVEFDSCSLAHGQVSNMMSHVDLTAAGGEQQETSLAYPNQADEVFSKGDLSWISCSICCVNRWKLVFVPCGHASCISCYKRLTKCHICRSHIDRVVKPSLSI